MKDLLEALCGFHNPSPLSFLPFYRLLTHIPTSLARTVTNYRGGIFNRPICCGVRIVNGHTLKRMDSCNLNITVHAPLAFIYYDGLMGFVGSLLMEMEIGAITHSLTHSFIHSYKVFQPDQGDVLIGPPSLSHQWL